MRVPQAVLQVHTKGAPVGVHTGAGKDEAHSLYRVPAHEAPSDGLHELRGREQRSVQLESHTVHAPTSMCWGVLVVA